MIYQATLGIETADSYIEYVFETSLDYGELYGLAEIDYFNVCEELGIEYDEDAEYFLHSVLVDDGPMEDE